MRFLPPVLCAALLASGCAAPLVRVAEPELASAGPPRLERAIDLGGLPLPLLGELSQGESDERCTPGEWVALVGANLHGATAVRVGGVPARVAGYLAGGSLLVQVPRGLPPGRPALEVETPAGRAASSLTTASYAFASDTHGGALRFRRFGPDAPGFEEDEAEVTLAQARFQATSPDGALLYGLQTPVSDTGLSSSLDTLIRATKSLTGTGGRCELLVVHLGAKDAPTRVGGLKLSLSSRPTGLIANGRGQLVILQERQLTVLDVSDPVAPREAGTLELYPADVQAQLVDAEFLDDRWLAVLEAYANEVQLVDLRDPRRPARGSSLRLCEALGQPFSIDLALGGDGTAWVLQGPNLRLAGKRLLDGLEEIGRELVELELSNALGAAGDTVTGVAMRPGEVLCRLVQVRHEQGQLSVVRALPLPQDLFPFFLLPDGSGSVYVSGINRTVLDLARLEPSLDGLVALLEMLKDATQLGRVVKVAVPSGRTETVRKGVAIYYDLCLTPQGGLMTSTVRLGPGYLPPRVTLDWGLETETQFMKLREVANSTISLGDALQRLLPPYEYERVGVQR